MATTEVIAGNGRPATLNSTTVSVPVVGRLSIVVWLYVLSIALPIGFSVGTLSLSFMRVILLVVVIPLCINLFRGKYGRIIPTDWLLFAHIVWATVCLSVNNPDRVVENTGSYAIELIGGYLVGRAFIRSMADFLALARLLILLVFIWLPFALLETKTDIPLILNFIEGLPGVSTFANVDKETRMGLERVQLVFAHQIHMGLFTSIIFSLVFVGFRDVYGDVKRWLVAAATGLLVFLSLSSGAFLALILQFGIIFWHFVFRNNNRKWSILLGLFALAYVTIDLLSNRTPIRVFMSYATFSPHTAYWRGLIFEYGMQNVWANPIFGLGLRSWVRPGFMNSGSMDNFWLVMAVRYGIPGFLLITIAYADIVRRIGIRDFRADPAVSQMRLAWMFTFMGLSFTLCTVHIWSSIFSFVFMMLGAGVWMITHTPETGGMVPAAAPAGRQPLRYAREGVAQSASAFVRPEAGTGYVRTPPPDAGPAEAVEPTMRRTSAPARYSRFSGEGDANVVSPPRSEDMK